MQHSIGVGDKVRFEGKVFEVSRNRYNGMLDLEKIYKRDGTSVWSERRECVYSDEVELVEKAKCGCKTCKNK